MTPSMSSGHKTTHPTKERTNPAIAQPFFFASPSGFNGVGRSGRKYFNGSLATSFRTFACLRSDTLGALDATDFCSATIEGRIGATTTTALSELAVKYSGST